MDEYFPTYDVWSLGSAARRDTGAVLDQEHRAGPPLQGPGRGDIA
jgi:hypothetical protein